MRRTSPGAMVVGQAEREELEFVANIFKAAAHQALDAVDGVVGGLDQILACGIADDDFAAGVEGDNRRHKIGAVFARE